MFEKLLENSGRKLMLLAKIMLILFTIGGIVAAIALFDAMDAVSLVFIPAGVLVGWCNSIVLYAFGTISSNISLLAEIAYKKEDK